MNVLRLRESIKQHEGRKLYPYRCPTGWYTIGYGRNLDINGISADEAELMLDNDLERAKLGAQQAVPGWFDLDDVRQEVLVEMAYQMGAGNLAKFRKMIASLYAQDWNAAADHALDSEWAQQTPTRAQTLAKRLRTGEY